MGKRSVLLTTIGNNIKEKRRCQVIKLFTMVLTLFYTISCNSNQYFFDEKRQQIVSCYTIVALDVLDLKTGDIYFYKENCR